MATQSADYLAARIHGRLDLVPDDRRLAELARLSSLPAFARALRLPPEAETSTAIEQALDAALTRELAALARDLGGVGGALLGWIATRRYVEDLALRLRDACRTPVAGGPAEPPPRPPIDLAPAPWPRPPSASLEEWADALPVPVLRAALRDALHRDRDRHRPWPFFLETALERAYLVELLSRARRLPAQERDLVLPLVRQEIDLFHLRLLLHAHADGGAQSTWISALHISGAKIGREDFEALRAGGMGNALASHAVRSVLGNGQIPSAPPPGPLPESPLAHLERQAWQRYRLLALRAVRRSHVGVGALVGYAGLRRTAVAASTTLAEGIRLGIDPRPLLARLHGTGFPENPHA